MKLANESEYEIGIIGLGTMGRNLLFNIRDHGYSGIGLDNDNVKVQLLQKDAGGDDKIAATQEVQVFIGRLRQPRALLLLVPAGKPVDDVLKEIIPFLSPGDLVIDTGNSHFKDTDRREKFMTEQGFYFFGMGVSGGEAGARHGPSLMPGGDPIAYERVRPLLEAIAAKFKEEPCVTYLGPGSSGHYVKMIHNAIEYGLMQLIAETYFLLKTGLHLSDDECHEVYRDWNQSELNSYLLEITAQIFLQQDDKSDRRLIDVILDVAKQKGTGMWACQDAMELQVPLPTLDAAVAARDLSAFVADRKKARVCLQGAEIHSKIDREVFLRQLRSAYYVSSLICFAQGMALLQKASVQYHYNLKLESIARIWRGGCIIRAAVLEPIIAAFKDLPGLSNLLLNPHLAQEMGQRQEDLRSIVQISARFGFPIPAFMASLGYYDSFRSSWLPANLIQAQRDYFGAHTYERIDQAGSFHSEWGQS